MPKPPNRHLSCVKIELPEARYKSDLELHDRFQSFSAELLRLALAGIAVFGLFLTLLGNNDTDEAIKVALKSSSCLWLSTSSLASFALAVAFALIHRFLAADGLYHHIRAIKLLVLLEDKSANPAIDFSGREEKIRLKAISDEANRNKKFSLSEHALKVSAEQAGSPLHTS